MAKRLTPMERFIAEIPSDRRRAYDARQQKRGLVRVTVTVPIEHTESLKTFGRLLRNSDPAVIAMYRVWLEEYLGDTYRDFDEWEAAERLANSPGSPERTERSEGAPRGRSAARG